MTHSPTCVLFYGSVCGSYGCIYFVCLFNIFSHCVLASPPPFPPHIGTFQNVTSAGKASPGRVRTLKDQEQMLNEFKKENFGLKLRIYHLEEALRKRWGDKDDGWQMVSGEFAVHRHSVHLTLTTCLFTCMYMYNCFISFDAEH